MAARAQDDYEDKFLMSDSSHAHALERPQSPKQGKASLAMLRHSSQLWLRSEPMGRMPCLDWVLRKQLGQPPGNGLLALQAPAGEEEQLGPRRADEPQRALRACMQSMSRGLTLACQPGVESAIAFAWGIYKSGYPVITIYTY